jgi:hypothetical protein
MANDLDPCPSWKSFNAPPDKILGLRLPEPGEHRARKVISRSKERGTGKYPSWKVGRMIHWESPHELNVFRQLDANPEVTEFGEQPLVVDYWMDGIQHKHYPDVKVTLRQVKELWEIKTRADATDPIVINRTNLMTKGLPHFGYQYRMVIADEISKSVQLKNALTLLRFGRADIPLLERERLRALLTKVQGTTWGAILAGAFGPRGRKLASRLILEGDLRFDFNNLLCEDTYLELVTSSPYENDLYTMSVAPADIVPVGTEV